MASTRKRRLDPQMWDDEAIFEVSRDARLLFVGLITQADDDGRVLGRPRWILSKVFPEDALEPSEVQAWLEELHAAELIWLYEVEGKAYIWLPGWEGNQHIDKRYYEASKLPEPPATQPARELQEQHASDTRAAREGDPGDAREQHASDTRPIGDKRRGEDRREDQPRSTEASPPPSEGEDHSSDSSSLPANGEQPTSEVSEAQRLCDLLADLIAENDPDRKRPKVGKEWLTEADRMLRLDERRPREAERLIEWTQADSFWRKNVRSMPKFREKYAQLYLAAVEDAEKRKRQEKREEHPADRRLRELRERGAGEGGQVIDLSAAGGARA